MAEHGVKSKRRLPGVAAGRTSRERVAMAAGVTDRLREVSDVGVLLEADEPGLERAV